MPRDELRLLLEGYGHDVLEVAGDDPRDVHEQMAAALDTALDRIAAIQHAARTPDREDQTVARPRWPMLVLRTPKGWTGPHTVDGKPVEGTWRSHQVPLSEVRDNPKHLAQLAEWLKSYGPEVLFDKDGVPVDQVRSASPSGNRRMSANPRANGGELLRVLQLPDFRDYAVDVPSPGQATSEATRELGKFLRDVIRENPEIFRLFGPDETASNRLGSVF